MNLSPISTLSTVQRLLVTAFAIAPVATVALVAALAGGTYLPDEYAWAAVAVALVAWSPLPISVPALVLQEARDAYLPGGPVFRRAIGMLPHLTRRGGFVAAVSTSTLAGFTAAVAAAVLVA